MPPSHEVTRLLTRWAAGDQDALSQLTPMIYRELHRLAASYLRKERDGHTLEPTALVHEAYLRLVEQNNPSWENRSHFYGVAARLMRQILVDYARHKNADKRAQVTVPLEEAIGFPIKQSQILLALDMGLNELERFDLRKSKVVELRYFGGLSMDEIAQALAVSAVTVRRDLRIAEAWLHKQIQGE